MQVLRVYVFEMMSVTSASVQQNSQFPSNSSTKYVYYYVDNQYRIQAGQYKESLELLEELRKIEEEQMGARTEKMAEIYQLMSKTKSEVFVRFSFVTECLRCLACSCHCLQIF